MEKYLHPETEGLCHLPVQGYLPAGRVEIRRGPDPLEAAVEDGQDERRPQADAEVPLGFPRYRWLLLLGDVVLISLAIIAAVGLRVGFGGRALLHYSIGPISTLVLYPLALYIFDLYNVERVFRSWETTFRSAIAVALGTLLAVCVFYAVPLGPYGRGVMVIEASLAWYLLNLWRWSYGIVFQKTGPKVPTLILGAGFCGRTICRLLKSPLSPYEVKGFLDDNLEEIDPDRYPAVMGRSDQLLEIAAGTGAHTVILAIPKNRSVRLIRTILDARLKGIDVRDMADVYEALTGRIPVRGIADQWLLFAEGFYLLRADYAQKLKRLIDFLASGIILFFMSPVIAVAVIAIKLDSPGPVFYTQQRVGKDRQVFTIYKFRSMESGSEKAGARWAAEKDPRVTRVGKLLRLTHIDELPQIWNIFKGDMSLVGPRPERPEFVDTLEDALPYYYVRHTVKPGLTGWAQINYRYGASVEDAHIKLEYDLYYVKNMSVFLDLKILLRTVGVVLLKDGSR
ncbi:MAG: UDP-N-acetylgalactosamine-undecaprenyl-phosphate N-acetylgalactosaminephosphotransferase [Syntrophorhabdus sp. PtaB.Bin184]|jgi:sugar transferase (PEP-CTERM system associated)|nr:MAG: UDP-N-acetylgalactosamine-undecaprenyl-phosphate N-acetylgalactosaminephosphotransferase [Syntrophorhabdus sp. PtaB.Bin184]